MTAERPNTMTRPIGLARHLFDDKTMLTSLLEVGGPISPADLKRKCAKTVRDFDPTERIVFTRVLLDRIIHSQSELEMMGASTLFKIPEVRDVPHESLLRGLQKTVDELKSRGLVTVLERSILQDILDSLDPSIDQEAVARLKRELSSIVPDLGSSQEVEIFRPTTVVPYEQPQSEPDDQGPPDLKVLNGGRDVRTLPRRNGNIRTRIPRKARHLASVKDEPSVDKRAWIEQRKAEIEMLHQRTYDMSPEQIEDLVVELRGRGDFRRFEIERATGLSESEYDKMIKKLVSEGRVVKNTRGPKIV